MAAPDTLRDAKIPLTHGSGAIPALGFGTLIPDPLATKQATKAALEVGFRHFDSAEGRVCHHQALEQQSSSRADQTRLRGESPATETRPCRLLSHPYPLCLP